VYAPQGREPAKLVKPLNLSLGIFNAIIGFLALISLIVIKYTVPFSEINLWLILSGIMAFAGLIITAFSFIGDYVGKIYQETKQRPKYFIDKTTNDIKNEKN
jgi:Kef-type K+ transport system membrane component KefB